MKDKCISDKNLNMPKIGTCGLITGSRIIGDKKWKDTYPNNIFGKVIAYEICLNRYVLVIRTNRKLKYKGFKTRRHSHSVCEIKFFKKLD